MPLQGGRYHEWYIREVHTTNMLPYITLLLLFFLRHEGY